MLGHDRPRFAPLPESARDLPKLLSALRRDIGALIDADENVALPEEFRSESSHYRVIVQLHPSLSSLQQRAAERLAESLRRSCAAHASYRKIAGSWTVSVEACSTSTGPAYILELEVISPSSTALGAARLTKAAARSRQTPRERFARRVNEEPTADARDGRRTAPALRSNGDDESRATRLVNGSAREAAFDPSAYILEINMEGELMRVPFNSPEMTIGRKDPRVTASREGVVALANCPDTVSRRQLVFTYLRRPDGEVGFEVLNCGANACRIADTTILGAAREAGVNSETDAQSRATISLGMHVALPAPGFTISVLTSRAPARAQ